MSFDILKSADYIPKKKEISLTIGDKNYVFYASEITHYQRLHLASIQHEGGDFYTPLVVYSITDQAGAHMTLAQASALSVEHAGAFFKAAAEVNSLLPEKSAEQDEKN